MPYRIIIAFFSFLLFCSCSRSIKYNDTPPAAQLKGKLFFIGCQLQDPAVSFTEIGSTSNRIYIIPFKHPEYLLTDIKDALPADLKERIFFKPFTSELIEEYSNDNAVNGYMNSYSRLTNCIAVFDSSERGYNSSFRLDPLCMDYLNDNLNGDYYMVIVGLIKRFQHPEFINFYNFMLIPEICVNIYDYDGNKVYSKLYTVKYEKIPDDCKKTETYYKYLLDAFEKYKAVFVSNLNQAMTGLEIDQEDSFTNL